MESISPAILAILITLGLSAVGLIVWLVRLEGKTNLNASTLSEKVDDADELHASIQKDHKGLAVEFWKHVADAKAHHNEEANREFRAGLERRLDGMEAGIKDIGRKLNHMNGRE